MICASPFLTVTEAAEYLRLSARTLYNLVAADKITARKHGGRLVFHREELDAWSLSRVKSSPVRTLSPSRFQIARTRVGSLKTRTE